MNPVVKKAIETRDALVKLLRKFKLFNEDFYLEINVYDFTTSFKNELKTKAGFKLRGGELWSEPSPTPKDLEKLMKNIKKLTGLKIEYDIDDHFAYPICFFSLEDLDKLHDIVYLTARMYN